MEGVASDVPRRPIRTIDIAASRGTVQPGPSTSTMLSPKQRPQTSITAVPSPLPSSNHTLFTPQHILDLIDSIQSRRFDISSSSEEEGNVPDGETLAQAPPSSSEGRDRDEDDDEARAIEARLKKLEQRLGDRVEAVQARTQLVGITAVSTTSAAVLDNREGEALYQRWRRKEQERQQQRLQRRALRSERRRARRPPSPGCAELITEIWINVLDDWSVEVDRRQRQREQEEHDRLVEERLQAEMRAREERRKEAERQLAEHRDRMLFSSSDPAMEQIRRESARRIAEEDERRRREEEEEILKLESRLAAAFGMRSDVGLSADPNIAVRPAEEIVAPTREEAADSQSAAADSQVQRHSGVNGEEEDEPNVDHRAADNDEFLILRGESVSAKGIDKSQSYIQPATSTRHDLD